MTSKTPFYKSHKSLGAKMVDFHGWEMPLQYSGIIDEHENVRNNVGLFDVSHMGRFRITGTSAFSSVQSLITNDLQKIRDKQSIYSPICNELGGIVDDIIVYMLDSQTFLIVVNASNRHKDLEWIEQHLDTNAQIEDISDSTALLALQGPCAKDILKQMAPELELDNLHKFDLANTNLLGINCMIARTGYTGEDGFELFFDSEKAELWDIILEAGNKKKIKPAGLGARDTLRLEAGLLLYGNDMDETISPLEVSLKWTVKFNKPTFIGRSGLLEQKINRRLSGFEMQSGRIARHGNNVVKNDNIIGTVTSGSFSPTLKKAIGFCLLPVGISNGEVIDIDISGKLYSAKTTTTRFYVRP